MAMKLCCLCKLVKGMLSFTTTRHVCHAAGLARTLRELPSAEAIALRAEVIVFTCNTVCLRPCIYHLLAAFDVYVGTCDRSKCFSCIMCTHTLAKIPKGSCFMLPVKCCCLSLLHKKQTCNFCKAVESVQVAAKLQAAKMQRKALGKLIYGVTKQGL